MAVTLIVIKVININLKLFSYLLCARCYSKCALHTLFHVLTPTMHKLKQSNVKINTFLQIDNYYGNKDLNPDILIPESIFLFSLGIVGFCLTSGFPKKVP